MLFFSFTRRFMQNSKLKKTIKELMIQIPILTNETVALKYLEKHNFDINDAINEYKSKNIVDYINLLSKEHNISRNKVAELVETIFIRNFDKIMSEERCILEIKIDPDLGTIFAKRLFNVVSNDTDIDDLFEIKLADMKNHDPLKDYKVGDIYYETYNINDEKNLQKRDVLYIFQQLKQQINEINNQNVYDEWKDKIGEIIKCSVDRRDGSSGFLIDLTKASNSRDREKYVKTFGYLARKETIPGEILKEGESYNFLIKEVKENSKGWPVVLSRADKDYVKKIYSTLVPEIQNGDITINAISRIAGFKVKIAVSSNFISHNPVAICIGPKGSRVKQLSQALNGEKIEIIRYDEDIKKMTILACGVDNVIGLEYLEDKENPNESQMTVIVTDESFPIILGREGKNIKLIAQLLNLKVDLKNLKDAQFEGIIFETIESFGNLNYVSPRYNHQTNDDAMQSYNRLSEYENSEYQVANFNMSNNFQSNNQNDFQNTSEESFYFSEDLKELEEEFLSEIKNVNNDKKDE